MRFLFVLSTLFLLQSLLLVIVGIYENLTEFNPVVVLVLAACADFLYVEAHWVFCWRYWTVAELLVRVRG
jgi:hypothetical protein